VSRRYPVRNAKEVVKVLRKNGFLIVSQSGSHQKWRHANGRQVIVAMHGNKPIPIAKEHH
jgi:predicted RNA binding protein YcfA (HicA-like mRNA interferase family)